MKKVLGLPAFRRLLAVSMIDQLALSVGAVALAVLVYRRTGNAFGAAAFFLAADFGPAFVSPFFVARLDQRSARVVLASLYAAQAAAFVVLAWLVHRFVLVPVLVLALLTGTLALTAAVLVRATWTTLMPEAGVVRDANALVNGGYSIAFMVGPALGGGLVALGGTVAALLANSSAYLACVLVVATARRLPRPVPDSGQTGSRLRAALKYVRGEPYIRRLLSLQAVGMFFFAISIPVEVVFVEHVLHGGAGSYGALLAAWGAGAIAGSVVYARWRRLSSRLLMALGAGLLGGGFALMAVAPSLSVAIAGAVVAGGGNGIQLVAMRSALQESVADRWMALVLSLNQSLFQAVPGIGIAIGGVIAALAGARLALGVGAAGSLAVAFAMWAGLELARPAVDQPRGLAPADSDLAATSGRQAT